VNVTSLWVNKYQRNYFISSDSRKIGKLFSQCNSRRFYFSDNLRY